MTKSFYYNKEKKEYILIADDTDRMNYIGHLRSQSKYYAFQGFNSIIDSIGNTISSSNLTFLLDAQFKRCFDEHRIDAETEIESDKKTGQIIIRHKLRE